MQNIWFVLKNSRLKCDQAMWSADAQPISRSRKRFYMAEFSTHGAIYFVPLCT